MEKTISFTIPMDKGVLLETADYLTGLANRGKTAINTDAETELSPEAEADAMGERIDATVAAASEPLAAGAGELDTEGSPWDVRIHSGAKSHTKDGKWKLARNVDPTLVERVKAELLAVVPVIEAPPVVAAPVVEAPPAAVIPVEVPVVAPTAVAPVEAPPAVVPVVETPPAVVPVVPVTTYTELITLITDQSKPGGVSQANDVKDAIKAAGAGAMGVTTLPELAPAQHIAYIPLVAAELRKIWATRA